MKVQVLPSSIDQDGRASQRQHLLSVIIDDRVAIDAGSLAMACSDLHRKQVRDIILTHTHLDHIAGLPMFVDDLFAVLDSPICVHAPAEMIEILERDIFNWCIYPRFSELKNEKGPVLEYCEFAPGSRFDVAHLSVQSVKVNHPVDAHGYIAASEGSAVAISGDTAETSAFWDFCNAEPDLKAVFIECAFPDELESLAVVSEHLTPSRLRSEVQKLSRPGVPIYVINLKPMYRERILSQLAVENIPGLQVAEIGRVYEF